jgi:hypothetical protein
MRLSISTPTCFTIIILLLSQCTAEPNPRSTDYLRTTRKVNQVYLQNDSPGGDGINVPPESIPQAAFSNDERRNLSFWSSVMSELF